MSRLAASLLVVLVLAALATVLGEEVLLDGLHRRRVALLVGNPYGQPVTYTDSQRVSAAKRRETVRNGCESARISCEIRYETSLNFADVYANFAKFTRTLRKSAKECMVRNRCESICRLAIWAKRPRNARETPRNSGESYETAANILRNCVSHWLAVGIWQLFTHHSSWLMSCASEPWCCGLLLIWW